MLEQDIDKLFQEYGNAIDKTHAKVIAQTVLEIIDNQLSSDPENYPLYLKKFKYCTI